MKKGARSVMDAGIPNADMHIYTRAGDGGLTSLFGGKRLSKSDIKVEAYGSIDELSSFVGLLISSLKDDEDTLFLIAIQKDFYKIMARLSGAEVDLSYLEKRVLDFEKKIDLMDEKLRKIKKFILPGGNRESSLFHIVRAMCRKSERRVISAYIEEREVIKYLNRLSDLFFMMARKYGKEHEIFA